MNQLDDRVIAAIIREARKTHTEPAAVQALDSVTNMFAGALSVTTSNGASIIGDYTGIDIQNFCESAGMKD
jgi:hypothetical protein